DLLTRKAYEFDAQGRAKEVPVPSELAAEVESRRSPLVEAAAETDDTLLEKYLESGELSDAEVTGALAKGVAAGAIVPVLCSAAGKSIGIGSLLDAIVALLPSPRQAPPVTAVNPRTDQSETLTREPAGPLGAIVFKTTADPVVGAKNKADEEKVNAALVKLVDEDPTLTLEHEPITKETIVHGLGDIHLDVVLEKMKRKYGVEGTLAVPRVPYQETITSSAKAEKKYKKQSG